MFKWALPVKLSPLAPRLNGQRGPFSGHQKRHFSAYYRIKLKPILIIKMLENRPEDALDSLVETVETVETAETVETVETVGTVGTVETRDTAKTVETVETVETIQIESLK